MLTRMTWLLLTVAMTSFASSFCAARVLLTNDRGRPTTGLVRLLDPGGHVVDQSNAPGGEARFCDFGFGDYTIDIGGTTCQHVMIPHVRVLFGKSIVYKVLLSPCYGGDVILTGCLTYFRVESSQGNKLGGVQITADSGRKSETDEYGRAEVSVEVGDSLTFVFSKDQYLSASMDLECVRPGYAEKSVTLMRAGEINERVVK